LKSLAQIENKELKERIIEKVFNPLLENNKTEVQDSSTDDEEMEQREKHHRYVDGGKLPPKTQKEIK